MGSLIEVAIGDELAGTIDYVSPTDLLQDAGSGEGDGMGESRRRLLGTEGNNGAGRIDIFDLRRDGRVALHQDFWDAAGGLYEHVPMLGGLIRQRL
ncbi:MAG: hypothetical protein U5K76_12275 [Woeseiaceae bacterium]|nr:hypothetical protein [Woeseiaceae bacterium]